MTEQEEGLPLAEVQPAPEVEVQAEVAPEETGPVATKDEDGTFKLDLTGANEKPAELVEPEVTEVIEPVAEVAAPEEFQALEEITDEEVSEIVEELQDDIQEAIEEKKESGIELPENIQKVVEFMNDTGGSLEDYVKLNTDYSSLNETQLLKEYYESSRPHLDSEEIDFLMEDNFSYDEELDDERDVRKKKIAHKEELAKAKSHLDGLKSTYYEEIKAGSKLNPEQQKAVTFFDRYNKEQEQTTKLAEKQKSSFIKKTDAVFSEEFKGFEYNVGDKRYRFNVKNADQVKSNQSDINNFVKKFLNDKNEIGDAKGYHKSLFTAMNPDTVAQHFYEQGKADAMKESMARSKNVDMKPRGVHEKVTTSNGWSVKAVDGADVSQFKVKIRK
tara:strand:- start:3742 stop:4902 length:1161 start_codon:yes stop_codon:yes gene_type:complete